VALETMLNGWSLDSYYHCGYCCDIGSFGSVLLLLLYVLRWWKKERLPFFVNQKSIFNEKKKSMLNLFELGNRQTAFHLFLTDSIF